MNFLTEDDIRARNVGANGVLCLSVGERLTPSASEYATQLHIRIVYQDSAEQQNVCATVGAEASALGVCGTACAATHEVTYLDQGVQVPKNHPAIIMRGKLDSLLANIVLVQTQFDPKDRKPAFLKQCLGDLHAWVMLILRGEITGETVCPAGMGGMDVETLHVLSREPKKYLGLDHVAAHASMGGNVALLNWLRTTTRETEVAAVNCSKNMDVLCALNRLSSAIYVLMLLTFAAEQGIDLATLRKA